MRVFKVFAAMAACAVLACASAQAGYITSNGTVQMRSDSTNNGGPNPPLIHIQEFGLGAGQLWTNQVNGAPFAIGSTVRTVGAISITDLVNGSSLSVDLPDGTPAHIIFAVEGVIRPGGIAEFSAGSLFITPSVTGNASGVFDISDPLSFNFDDAVAKYDMGAPMSLTSGQFSGIIPSGNVSVAGGDMNKSGLATIANSGNGAFVFLEDPNFVPGGVTAGLGSFVGDEFLRDVVSLPNLPNAAEGLSAITDQTQDIFAVTLSAAQIAALDTIGAAAGFGGAFSEGGFDPKGLAEGPQTGDFSADLSSELYVIAAPVPEPTSFAIFAIGTLAAVGRRGKRNRKS